MGKVLLVNAIKASSCFALWRNYGTVVSGWIEKLEGVDNDDFIVSKFAILKKTIKNQ